jgi:hypothetical protein
MGIKIWIYYNRVEGIGSKVQGIRYRDEKRGMRGEVPYFEVCASYLFKV